MTAKQQRAKERNFNKMRVKGMLATAQQLKEGSYTHNLLDEAADLAQVVKELKHICINWDLNSRKLGMHTKGV